MFLLRFLLFLQTSAVSRIRYIQNTGFASILILPLLSLAQMNGIVKLPNQPRFMEIPTACCSRFVKTACPAREQIESD